MDGRTSRNGRRKRWKLLEKMGTDRGLRTKIPIKSMNSLAVCHVTCNHPRTISFGVVDLRVFCVQADIFGFRIRQGRGGEALGQNSKQNCNSYSLFVKNSFSHDMTCWWNTSMILTLYYGPINYETDGEGSKMLDFQLVDQQKCATLRYSCPSPLVWMS